MEVNRTWHTQVTEDLRNHLVAKVIKAIFPDERELELNEDQLLDVIQDAKEIEQQIYEAANDREEYYHMLAEKIYHIQRDIQAAGH